MAKIIPRAIGLCNLTEDQTWVMTPGEILGKIEANGKDREDLLRFFDMLNAKSIAENRAVHGSEDECAAKYLILPPKEEETEDDVDPEAVKDYLELIALTYKPPEE
jgi:hypothetical protein